MTTMNPTPPQAALVAIDVAKMRNEVLIEVPGRVRRRRLTVLNSRAEHDRFLTELHSLGQPVVVGLEATGNYHRPLAWRLLQAGFDVRLISSMALARTREALHNGWLRVPRSARCGELHRLFAVGEAFEPRPVT